MGIGDHILFTSTGCRGLVVKITQHNSTEFVHVLCGPDSRAIWSCFSTALPTDGDHGGEILAFTRETIQSFARIL
tara:strand:+ start:328 stop:552 length:225 start_codon:yes stop_codon:yes gene_type:complete